MHAEHVPVVVVGAGPAGLAAAIALARLGVETMLVERRAELSSLPRATAVSLRSMELIRSWGVEDAVRAGGRRRRVARMAVGHPGDGGRRVDVAHRHPDARAGRPAQPDRTRLRAAGSPRARAARAPALPRRRPRAPPHRGGGGRGRPEGVEVVLRDIAERRGPHGPRPLPRRRRRRAQPDPQSARHRHARTRRPRPRRHGDLPGAAVAGRRRAPLRRLLRQPPAGCGHLPALRARRPLALRDVGRCRRHRGLHAAAVRAADPRRRRHRRPRRLDRAHRLLQLRRPARRSLPRRQRVPRRRRRPPGDSARRHRDEHRDRAAGTTWAGSSAGCCAAGPDPSCWTPTRPNGGRSPRTTSPAPPIPTAPRARPPTSCTSTSAGASRTCGSAPTRGACPRWTSWAAGSRSSPGPTHAEREAARPAGGPPVTVRRLDAVSARSIGIRGRGGLLVRPDGTPAQLWTQDASAAA